MMTQLSTADWLPLPVAQVLLINVLGPGAPDRPEPSLITLPTGWNEHQEVEMPELGGPITDFRSHSFTDKLLSLEWWSRNLLSLEWSDSLSLGKSEYQLDNCHHRYGRSCLEPHEAFRYCQWIAVILLELTSTDVDPNHQVTNELGWSNMFGPGNQTSGVEVHGSQP